MVCNELCTRSRAPFPPDLRLFARSNQVAAPLAAGARRRLQRTGNECPTTRLDCPRAAREAGTLFDSGSDECAVWRVVSRGA